MGLLANGLLLLVVGQGPGVPCLLLALTNNLLVNITLSDLLLLARVVPVLLLCFLQHDWWLGPAVCTTSQAGNSATMFSVPSTAWRPQLFFTMQEWSSLTWSSLLAGVPACCSVEPYGSWASLRHCLPSWSSKW